ncbi:MAG TPA: heme o synthase, partial [Chloroflexia bacterium]|nr:heme o synthase [Chloroflexia bacterium]
MLNEALRMPGLAAGWLRTWTRPAAAPARWYQRLTVATAIATWALIVLGGVVRATDSGLGCATWPLCDGSLLPRLEYHQLIEWTHRFFATLVGCLMLATVGATLIWYRRPRRLFWLAIGAGVTYLAQAILGGITVLLKLPPTWIAAHMGNSMLLLAAVILLALFARLPQCGVRSAECGIRRGDGLKSALRTPHSALRGLALATTLWTYVAMFTGSAVVGAAADLACPDWPQCSASSLWPLTLDQWINFGHRLAVGFSDGLMVLLALAIWRWRRADRRLLRVTHGLALVYVAQVFLGAFTIWTGAPPAMKSAHLALAAATWGALVIMTALVWLGAPDPAPPGPRGRAVPRPAGLVQATRYFSLIKPRVIPLLLIPTAAAMLIAAVHQPPAQPLLALIAWTLLGGTLATGGAHAINSYLDRDLDGQMRRTRHRPVVTGQIAPGHALRFGVALTGLAVVQLGLTTNWLAATLALAGNLFYVFVYTIWLKRTSTQNIVIGGAAGAVPPLVGWAAVTGSIGVPALLFFAIIFFWTPAHFWALALVRQEDYRAAGIPMLP